jgi:sugar transferase (PEP-CTERM/EpsH1 system associated)
LANILYLVHRLPYPPNKGDKVRSYHLLKHLLQQHRVFLGTFVDDPDDEAHLPLLRRWCADVCAVPLQPRAAKVRSLTGLAHGEPLTLHYYDSPRLHDWVRSTRASQRIDAAVVFSSSMAQYAEAGAALPTVVDLVDVDSAKWTDYAAAHTWPMSWLYRREGERLLAYERAVVARSHRSFLVTDKEVELFGRLAPECSGKMLALCNGVDAEHFAPQADRASPFAAGERPLVFTGAMDYWPNVDAVIWFAREVMPSLRERWPDLRFHIVGRSPTPAVLALAGDAVSVSGTVPDVRPYLQHAAVVVAPLRLARGVQNKVLEAMAMGRPVISASSCIDAIGTLPGQRILAADDPGAYLAHLSRLLSQPAWADAVGSAGQRFVVDHFSWAARLAGLDAVLNSALALGTESEVVTE